MLPNPTRTVLCRDPGNRVHAINGYAFQQDALHTFNGWQYACFYASLPNGAASAPLFVHLSRRQLPAGAWETLGFDDYPQTVDDGHNTVQLGVCPGDGTIHLSYDHHCDRIRYRHSIPGVATCPDKVKWGPELFTPTLSSLPGLTLSPEVSELLSYITYPRFVTHGQNLLFTFRTGKAGLGDDHLCVYSAANQPDSPKASIITASKDSGHDDRSTSISTDYKYTFLGTHLKGISNNPYIHGLDVSPQDGTLHMTWVYREFVYYDGWDDPADTKHKMQSGPNSAANNRDICYAWSDDGGVCWRSSGGRESKGEEEEGKGGKGIVIADLRQGESILPSSPGITAFGIPKGSGLINQEAQAVDRDGGVHVLNRDSMDGGVQRWKHYYKARGEPWTQRALPYVDGVYGGKRGQLAVSRDGDLYFVLPHHADVVLTVLKATNASRYAEYELVWRGEGFPPSEPLVDKARLDQDNILSVFTKVVSKPEGEVDVVVLDFQL
ncbi:hypothetical protein F5Y16DRAFT_57726 [Xylariaceae sp. FL0255]|nr:hypothetical protein F5Y16DRAFT_57726 [Xylariaceae sp. FL0255]